eukprot:TRINITY_DN7457_c0_g1_i1.p1 TRINITY_DN7457_c0_g1~~TRINITY_DN7457_c0_g1_i1.p1  ORF type:complete len:491 (+),score=80.42 TRINITY_DN7457_c0_g1_i1:30-1475(+)
MVVVNDSPNTPKEVENSENQNLIGDYILYPRRWLVLLAFSLTSFSNAYQWVMYAPIFDVVSEQYDVGYFFVNLLSLAYFIIFVPGSFPAMWSYERYGLRRTLLIAASLNTTGATVRFLARGPASSGFLLGSAITNGLAQTPILGAPALIAGLWFGPSERTTATAIAVLANNLGIATALLLQPILVRSPAAGATTDPAGVFLASNIFQIAICSTALVLVVLFCRDRPPTPPALTSSASSSTSPSLGKSLQGLCRLDFLAVLVSFSLLTGNFWAIATVFAELFCSFDFDNQQMGLMGFLSVLVGIACTPLIGLGMDRWRRQRMPLVPFSYRLPLAVLALLSAITLAVLALALRLGGSFVVATLIYCVLGGLLNCVVPLALEFAVELTFPIPESVSSGVLMTAANVCGIAIILILTVVIDGKLDLSGSHACVTTAAQQATVEGALVGIAVCFGAAALLGALARGTLTRFVTEATALQEAAAAAL